MEENKQPGTVETPKLEEVLPFKCDVCGGRYRSAAGLGGHKWMAHQIGATGDKAEKARASFKRYYERKKAAKAAATGVAPTEIRVGRPRIHADAAARKAASRERKRLKLLGVRANPPSLEDIKQAKKEKARLYYQKYRAEKRVQVREPQLATSPAQDRLEQAISGNIPTSVNFCPCCGYSLKPHNIAAHVAGEMKNGR